MVVLVVAAVVVGTPLVEDVSFVERVALGDPEDARSARTWSSRAPVKPPARKTRTIVATTRRGERRARFE
jgi:hypothetical protein